MRGLHIFLFCLFALIGTIISCIGECPDKERLDRGTYYIVGGNGQVPTETGTIDIRETEVEIVYSDANNNEWHVVYKITGEE